VDKMPAYFGTIDVGTAWGAVEVDYPQQHVARRWEAAETNRLNEAHWQPVSDEINDALTADIKLLQQRCRHEANNNSVIDGGIETHVTNVVGSTGPTLQVLTDDDRFNSEIEQLLKYWSANCEFQDDLSLVDLLEGWTAQYLFNGEMLVQEIVGKGIADYRLHDLGAEAFDMTIQNPNIYGGIELDENQKVKLYHVCDPGNPGDKAKLPKEFTLHCYRRRFAMQRRGLPPMASSLPTAADMRDYDDQVQDAARAAADYSVIMYSDHPDADFSKPLNENVAVRRRTRSYAPPGWKPFELKASQPGITYDSYREQRHTDLAGTLGEMPLMIFRRSARNHNMSSARFDGARYGKAIDRFQRRLERRMLNPVLRRLVRIAQMLKLLRPTPMNRISRKLQYDFPHCVLPIAWTWPKPPPVDALKDSMAQRIQLENGTKSFTQVCAENGDRSDEVIRLRKKDNTELAANDLPPIIGALPVTDVELIKSIYSLDDEEPDATQEESTEEPNANQTDESTPTEPQ